MYYICKYCPELSSHTMKRGCELGCAAKACFVYNSSVHIRRREEEWPAFVNMVNHYIW